VNGQRESSAMLSHCGYTCDDTSGNKSKKWSKHNSFLFTFACLDAGHAHLLYNIHSLSTSDIASLRSWRTSLRK